MFLAAPGQEGALRQLDETQRYRRMSLAGHYLDQVLAQAHDGFVGLDADLRLLQWNDSAARQWRVPQRQALVQAVLDEVKAAAPGRRPA